MGYPFEYQLSSFYLCSLAITLCLKLYAFIFLANLLLFPAILKLINQLLYFSFPLILNWLPAPKIFFRKVLLKTKTLKFSHWKQEILQAIIFLINFSIAMNQHSLLKLPKLILLMKISKWRIELSVMLLMQQI